MEQHMLASHFYSKDNGFLSLNFDSELADISIVSYVFICYVKPSAFWH